MCTLGVMQYAHYVVKMHTDSTCSVMKQTHDDGLLDQCGQSVRSNVVPPVVSRLQTFLLWPRWRHFMQEIHFLPTSFIICVHKLVTD